VRSSPNQSKNEIVVVWAMFGGKYANGEPSDWYLTCWSESRKESDDLASYCLEVLTKVAAACSTAVKPGHIRGT
jgi:hypothetical protein